MPTLKYEKEYDENHNIQEKALPITWHIAYGG